MTREELLKSLRPIEWHEIYNSSRKAYLAWVSTYEMVYIIKVNRMWITTFDEAEYDDLSEAKQAADRYYRSNILSHFNLEDK